MAVTQKDIARKLNLSVMTISRALKDHPDISEKTRKLVQETAREMNYTINLVARSLVQKRTNTIGVVVLDITEQFFAEIVRGIESVAREHQFTILLADSDMDADLEYGALLTLISNRVDGLIISSKDKAQKTTEILKNLTIPYILIVNTLEGLECDSVSFDRAYGAKQAISHLITRGYEQFYLLYSYEHKELSQSTIQGCYEALDEFGVPHDVLKLFPCRTHDPEPYYKTTMEQIQYQGKRIGIFAWDDQTAIGVYRAIIDKGLSIPEQAGIVGFDDIKLARFFPKSLTTIYCPKIEMGQKAAERLIQQITSDTKLEPQKLKLPLKLIARETT